LFCTGIWWNFHPWICIMGTWGADKSQIVHQNWFEAHLLLGNSCCSLNVLLIWSKQCRLTFLQEAGVWLPSHCLHIVLERHANHCLHLLWRVSNNTKPKPKTKLQDQDRDLRHQDQDQDQDFSVQDQDQDFQNTVSRCLETKTQVSRTPCLKKSKIWRKTIFNMAEGILTPCNVAGGSGIICHWIRPKVRHIGILLLVSISAVSPQSTCHSAPVCEILSNSDHP